MIRKLIPLLILLLSACNSLPTPAPHVVFQTVEKPIIIVPAPPIVTRPDLAINNLTPDQQTNMGQLVMAYKVTIKELENYAIQLEAIVAKYDELSKNNPVLTIPDNRSHSPVGITHVP